MNWHHGCNCFFRFRRTKGLAAMTLAQPDYDIRTVATVTAPPRKVALSVRPRISVIGLGYVGAVSIACLSNLGFKMIGVDTCAEKVKAIQSGKSPIVEKHLENLLYTGCRRGDIKTTQSIGDAVMKSDISFISVGTPTAEDGSCDIQAILAVSEEIGTALAGKQSYHLVVLRCSVPPGTTRKSVIPMIEAMSGKRAGEDFGVCFNPEFLREGVAISDFYEPPKTVIGASDSYAAEMLAKIFALIDDDIIHTSIECAEMVKYVDNVWHATKITFANEIGRICKPLEIDSHKVMDIFVQDTKLNLSPYYLKPGFAFGGSCLPKEVRAVEHLAQECGVRTPLISSLMPSNCGQIEQAFELAYPYFGRKFGFLGLSFKAGTDDLRESPTIELMSLLLDHNQQIAAYDPNLRLGPALKDQIEYARHATPRLTDLMAGLADIIESDLDALLVSCDVLIVSHCTREFREAVRRRRPGTAVIDLVRLFRTPPRDAGYHGIAW